MESRVIKNKTSQTEPDANGVKRCYYFNLVSDGYRGKLLRNTVIDGSTVNADGARTVNGVVQTK